MARERYYDYGDDEDDDDRDRGRYRDRDRDDYDDRPRYRPGDVPNYLAQSILVTLCCCLPFGIAAIISASQVNSKLSAGDRRGAVESSDKAKQYCWISFGLGLVGNVIYIAAEVMVEMGKQNKGFGP